MFDWASVDIIPPVPEETPLRNFSGPLNLDFITNDAGNDIGLRATYTSYFQETFRIESNFLPSTNETYPSKLQGPPFHSHAQ